MGKKRRTRQQKIISDLRRKVSLQSTLTNAIKTADSKNNLGVPVSITKVNIRPTAKSAGLGLQNDYSYLIHDFKKTAILIGLAIALQIVLYLALR